MRDLLSAPGLGIIHDTEDNRLMWSQIDLIMSRLVLHINQADPRLKLVYQYSGSTADGTKVGLLDEVNVHLVIKALTGALSVNPRTEDQLVSMTVIQPDVMSELTDFLGNDNELKPDKLYSYMFKLLCQAVSDKSIITDMPIYWRTIDTQGVVMTWATTGALVKIDYAFVVELPDWVPPNTRTTTKLLPIHSASSGCHARLLCAGWQPSAFAREQLIIRNMPLVQRLAYMVIKVANELVLYEAGDRSNVKTDDIKSSLLFELEVNTLMMRRLRHSIRARRRTNSLIDIVGGHQNSCSLLSTITSDKGRTSVSCTCSSSKVSTTYGSAHTVMGLKQKVGSSRSSEMLSGVGMAFSPRNVESSRMSLMDIEVGMASPWNTERSRLSLRETGVGMTSRVKGERGRLSLRGIGAGMPSSRKVEFRRLSQMEIGARMASQENVELGRLLHMKREIALSWMCPVDQNTQLKTEMLQEVQEWVTKICKRLQDLERQPKYYFGFGSSQMEQKQLDLLFKYTNMLVHK